MKSMQYSIWAVKAGKRREIVTASQYHSWNYDNYFLNEKSKQAELPFNCDIKGLLDKRGLNEIKEASENFLPSYQNQIQIS